VTYFVLNLNCSLYISGTEHKEMDSTKCQFPYH